jgi:hypothetical protein
MSDLIWSREWFSSTKTSSLVTVGGPDGRMDEDDAAELREVGDPGEAEGAEPAGSEAGAAREAGAFWGAGAFWEAGVAGRFVWVQAARPPARMQTRAAAVPVLTIRAFVGRCDVMVMSGSPGIDP